MARVTGDVPKESLPALQNMLANAPDAAFASLSSVSLKSTPVTICLAFFLGGLGVDRFYIGDIGLGVAKLLLGWATFGIWPFVDIFVSYRKARKKNFENLSLIRSGRLLRAGGSRARCGLRSGSRSGSRARLCSRARKVGQRERGRRSHRRMIEVFRLPPGSRLPGGFRACSARALRLAEN